MAVNDAHCDTQRKFSDETLFASPEQGTEKIEQESIKQTPVEVCAKPLVDTVIVTLEGNAETTEHNSTPKKKKKKKKKYKNEEGELQLQKCDSSSISIGVESIVTNEEGSQLGDCNENRGLGCKPLLDTPIPVVPQEEIDEANIQNPTPTPKKKKREKKKLQICDSSIPIGVEPGVSKEEGAQQSDANVNTDHEIAVPGIIEELPVPDSSPSEVIHRKKKSRRKNESAVTEPQEYNGTDSPQKCLLVQEPKTRMEKKLETNAEQSQVCPKPELVPLLDISIPSDLELNKREEPINTNAEHPQAFSKSELACPLDLPTPIVNPEKKKEVEPSEACSQHPEPQPCATTTAEHPGDATTPVDESRRKRKKKRGREKIMCSEEKAEEQGNPLHKDKTLNQAPNQVQQDPETICPQPASLTDQKIPVDPAIPIKKEKKTKKQKNLLDGEEANDNKHNTEQPGMPIQTSACLIAAPAIDPSIPVDSCPAMSTDPEQMSKKKRKKERKNAVKSEAVESNEHNSKPPEALPGTPVQESIYPIAAPLIDSIFPIFPAAPIDTAPPIEQDQNLLHVDKTFNLASNQVQQDPATICPRPASLTDQTIPVNPAIPIDLEQKRKKKRNKLSGHQRMKRKRSKLISEGTEISELEGKPPEVRLESFVYPIVAPSIDPTTPISQGKKTRRKKRKRSDLIIEGVVLNEDDSKLPRTPVQRTEGPTTENSRGAYNAGPSAKTLVPRTDSLRDTEFSFKQHDKRSVECWSCRRPGHTFESCWRLKRLSKNEEVCFFCGEIGHSLGKCSVSHAGGGRFAKCLLCYGHGHFSYNCPRNGHSIDPKVVAANGAINGNGHPQDGHGHFSYNCPQNGHGIIQRWLPPPELSTEVPSAISFF